MAKTLFALKKEGSTTNAFEVLDTAGVVSVKIDGLAVMGEQAAAQADTAGATATAIAAVVPSAAPAGGTGTAAGGWDTAANRDAAIVTINDLRTHAIEMDLDYEALLVDVNALRTTVNALLAKLRTHGIIAT